MYVYLSFQPRSNEFYLYSTILVEQLSPYFRDEVILKQHRVIEDALRGVQNLMDPQVVALFANFDKFDDDIKAETITERFTSR